jgi:DNA-binding MarR family transcriptional regulator
MSAEADTEQLAEELRLAIGRLVRRTRAETDEMPRGRAETLARLEAEGPQTIAQLAEHRAVRHQAMSRGVADLEDLGLVLREPSPTDARAFLIRISAEGRRALDRERRARRATLASAIAAHLDDEERAVLRRVPALLAKLTP